MIIADLEFHYLKNGYLPYLIFGGTVDNMYNITYCKFRLLLCVRSGEQWYNVPGKHRPEAAMVRHNLTTTTPLYN